MTLVHKAKPLGGGKKPQITVNVHHSCGGNNYLWQKISVTVDGVEYLLYDGWTPGTPGVDNGLVKVTTKFNSTTTHDVNIP